MRSLMLSVVVAMGCALVAHAQSADEAQAYTITRSKVVTLTSEALGRSYDLYIRTPLGYDPEREKAYPVIYLNDGPYTFLVASGAAHLPMNAQVIERAIIVGLSHAKGENGMDSRVRDFTHSEDRQWARQTGGAPAYTDFLSEEVIVHIETHYHADPQRRILSGLSLGGSYGVWVMLTQPDLFSGYILTSPSLWYNNKDLFDLEEAYARDHDDLSAQVYFATGSEEYPGGSTGHDLAGDQIALVEALQARHYPSLLIKSEIVEGGLHETTFPIGFMKGLQWMLGDET